MKIRTTCMQCGHIWSRRVATRDCPKCRSSYWNRPKPQTRLEWLQETIKKLTDDLTKPWWHYPCLEWPFGKSRRPHIPINGERTPVPVYRKSFEIANNRAPGKPNICHHCDNPRCFRPIHLFEGTTKDNAEDMVNKGRSAHGVRCHTNVYPENQILEVKRRIALGERNRDIVLATGVKHHDVSRIRHNKTWKHLKYKEETT